MEAPALDEATLRDTPVFDRISELATEEEELWERAGDGDGLDALQRGRLESIRAELDHCYSLLQERQARDSVGRKAGETGPSGGVERPSP